MKKRWALFLVLLLSACQSPALEAEQGEALSAIDETRDLMQESLDLTSLPLGDDMYSTTPKEGYVYTCQTNYNGGGAFQYGSWINQEDGTWDLTAKISVDGAVEWTNAYWSVDEESGMRVLASADLPVGHVTGEYPISSSDDAYQYDRNPNSIETQGILFSVPLNPELLDEPQCVGGEVGIATTGVLLFNAFDAGGRDAVAVEVQDICEGHPQAGGYYHYHGYSSCFDDRAAEDEHSDLLGYAFDGFGIYGLKGEDGVELSSEDLDICHGHTHEIEWNGETRDMYHYHFTHDFPYTVSCFRGEPAVHTLSEGEGGALPGPGGGEASPSDRPRP